MKRQRNGMALPSDLRTSSTLPRRPRVLSVSSGKGGVGKTSFTLNLAFALSRLGQQVLVFDNNLGLGNIDVLLGLTPKFSIEDFFSQRKSFLEILLQDPNGISVIPAGSGFPELANLNDGQKISLLNEVELIAKKVNYVLIDAGSGISSNVLYFNMVAQESIVIVTPEPTSIANVIVLIKTLSTKHAKKHFTLLVNLAANENEARAVFKKIVATTDRCLSNVSIHYLGFVPLDKKLAVALRNQELVLEVYPESPSSKSLKELAKTILEGPVHNKDDGPLHFFCKQLLQSHRRLVQ